MTFPDSNPPQKGSITHETGVKVGVGAGVGVLAATLVAVLLWWWLKHKSCRNHSNENNLTSSGFPLRAPPKVLDVPVPFEHQEYHEPEVANNPYRTASLRTTESRSTSNVLHNTGDPYGAAGVGRSNQNATRSSTLYDNPPREEDEQFDAFANAPSPHREPTLPKLRIVNATPPPPAPPAPPSYRPTDGSSHVGGDAFRVPRRPMNANRMNSVSTPILRTNPYADAVELPDPYRSRTPEASSSPAGRGIANYDYD